MQIARFHSPVGPLDLIASDRGLMSIRVHTSQRRLPPVSYSPDALLQRCLTQLEEYFAGLRRSFDLPLELQGTPFQRTVWDFLQQIPYGELRSYQSIAEAIGKPRAVRAVGAAVGSNPIPIVVPCHRVVGKDGALTGYSGGLAMKSRLIELERTSAGAPAESPRRPGQGSSRP
jgi:methylated-DNA-[protein]-cysteine S-methyltransferase